MKFSRKAGLWSWGAAGLLLAALGLGCMKHGNPAVRISSWGDEKENAILQGLINDFQKEHPETKVELLRVAYGEYMTKLFTQFAGGVAPDVIFVSTDDALNLASRGILEPLDDYIKADPSFPLSDYYPSLINDYTIDGHLYALPRDIDPECDIYYNKKLFDEAKLPYPKDDWNWNDFLKACKALTKRDASGKTTQWAYYEDWNMVEPWIYSSGGRWVDDSLHPTKFTFNDPNFIRGIQFRDDLIYKYKVMPSPANMKAEMGGSASEDLFANGIAAMFLSGLWHTPRFRDIKNFDWDIVEFPKGPEGKRGFSCGGSGYGVLSNSKNKKAAWDFVKYIAGAAGQSKMAATGLICPALKSVMNSPVFLDGKPPLNKKMLLGVIPDGVLAPRAKNWREVNEGTTVPTFDHVWLGEWTAQQAVSEIGEKLKNTVPIVK